MFPFPCGREQQPREAREKRAVSFLLLASTTMFQEDKKKLSTALPQFTPYSFPQFRCERLSAIAFPHRPRGKDGKKRTQREEKEGAKDDKTSTRVDRSRRFSNDLFFSFAQPLLFPFSPPQQPTKKQSSISFEIEPDNSVARTVVCVCLGLVGALMAGNVALWYIAQKTATTDKDASAKGAKKKVSKKKLKRETLRRGLPMPE